MNKEQQHFEQRIIAQGGTHSLLLADPQGMGFLTHANFDAKEAIFEPSPYLMLKLCTEHSGHFRRISNGPSVDGMIRPGTVGVVLPNTRASGFWPKAKMLSIAIDLEKFSVNVNKHYSVTSLFPAASVLHNDPHLTSVMTALWRDAEYHGLPSAFFEQGISVLLNRLSDYRSTETPESKVHALGAQRLSRVLDLIEERLGQDIRVAEMAKRVKQDPRTFTRSFLAATGLAPYQYVTKRRMEHACDLLLDETITITQTAQSVGYDNPSKFSAAFKRFYGSTPSNWRRKHRE